MQRCPVCNSFFDDATTTCPHDGAGLVPVHVEAARSGLEGKVVNERYELRESIGEGGMGMVYKGHDLQKDRAVALKVLHKDISDDERTVRRFFSEARVLSSLAHPNIIELYDFGRLDEGPLYIAMELLEGNPADELIKRGPMPVEQALDIIDQSAAALAEAHLQGVIHRDLKPANIFVTEKGDGTRHVTVLDFGIAKIAGSGQNLTATGKVMGTPSYMAPEQIRGEEPDPRTDIYALGAMGYELLAGKPPFMADGPIAVLFMHLERPPDPLDKVKTHDPVSRELAEAMDQLLAKAPADRPRNMHEVRKLLAPFLGREVEDPVAPRLAFDLPDLPGQLGDKPGGSPSEVETEEFNFEDQGGLQAAIDKAVAEQAAGPTPNSARKTVVAASVAGPSAQPGKRGASWWVGAVLVAILLAAALAIAVFLYLKGDGAKAMIQKHAPDAVALHLSGEVSR
jgi:serine/threonine-protein kinase